ARLIILKCKHTGLLQPSIYMAQKILGGQRFFASSKFIALRLPCLLTALQHRVVTVFRILRVGREPPLAPPSRLTSMMLRAWGERFEGGMDHCVRNATTA